MEHIIKVCCYGGEPYINYHLNHSWHTFDPTDWSAQLFQREDENTTIPPTINQIIDQTLCQFYNITFSSLADQLIFEERKADFECRCPVDRTGSSCELLAAASFLPPEALTDSIGTLSSLERTMIVLMVGFVLLFIMATLVMMVRGCFCDCFGNTVTRRDPYDRPLDPEDVRKCMKKVKENQAAREMAREPLVSHPPPIVVSESYSAPYSNIPAPAAQYPSAPPPMNASFRPSSPPPPYSDIDRK